MRDLKDFHSSPKSVFPAVIDNNLFWQFWFAAHFKPAGNSAVFGNSSFRYDYNFDNNKEGVKGKKETHLRQNTSTSLLTQFKFVFKNILSDLASHLILNVPIYDNPYVD